MEEKNMKNGVPSRPSYEGLEELVRLKVQQFIQDILEEEVTEFLGRQPSERRAAVDAKAGYRNGYGKSRRLSLKTGTITIRRPRLRNLEERFESRVLPLFKRRTKEISDMLPELYLHGLAQGDFELALRGLLGEGAPLSPGSISRLKEKWQREYDEWKKQPLEDLEVVYLWADGLYVKAGLEDTKAALLVVIGALRDGRKVILAVEPGARESTRSWGRILRDLKARGLNEPNLVIGDGHLGIWGAVREQFPSGEEQRCWNHKIVNVLDQLPKKVQPQAREMLCEIPYAKTEKEALRQRKEFSVRFRRDYPKAVEVLESDWERMVSFYKFPKEHWCHLRTTNVVESPFAAVRLRTSAAKRYKKVANATAMIWKLLQVAEKNFRRLNAPVLLSEVAARVKFVDGVKVKRSRRKVTAG